jgi:RNA recognition motif-containing protein
LAVCYSTYHVLIYFSISVFYIYISNNEGKKKLYVGNLPFDATVEDVRDFFSEFGEISDVFLPERDGRTRGFGFVTMDEESADLAIKETNGAEFMGRSLTVNEPLGKGEKMSRPRQCTSISNSF